MTDVSAKKITRRRAVAGGRIAMSREAFDALAAGQIKKGDALAVARIAAISAAKRTAELIPLCHTLPMESAAVDFELIKAESAVECTATIIVTAKTGAEMEALTAVSAGLLAIYDMCKSRDRAMTIGDIRLLEKSGGKSGNFRR